MNVVNELSNKFGVTAFYLIIEMQRYYMLKHGILAAVFFAVALASVFLVLLLRRKQKTIDHDLYLSAMYAFSIMFIISFVLFGAYFTSCITWAVTPTGCAVEKVIDTIK